MSTSPARPQPGQLAVPVSCAPPAPV